MVGKRVTEPGAALEDRTGSTQFPFRVVRGGLDAEFSHLLVGDCGNSTALDQRFPDDILCVEESERPVAYAADDLPLRVRLGDPGC